MLSLIWYKDICVISSMTGIKVRQYDSSGKSLTTTNEGEVKLAKFDGIDFGFCKMQIEGYKY